MKRPRCVLFDLDGTLVDTAPDLGHAANAVRRDQGLLPLPMEHYRPHASGGARALLRIALDIEPDDDSFPAHRDQFLDFYRNNLSRHSHPFPGVTEMLESLTERKVRWGIVTNKPDWLAQPLLQELGLASLSECSVGAQDGLDPKPAPDLLLHACAELGVAATDTAYVGDDRRDIVAGKAAGMVTVAAAWGYIISGDPIEQWNADAVIQVPGELPALWD